MSPSEVLAILAGTFGVSAKQNGSYFHEKKKSFVDPRNTYAIQFII